MLLETRSGSQRSLLEAEAVTEDRFFARMTTFDGHVRSNAALLVLSAVTFAACGSSETKRPTPARDAQGTSARGEAPAPFRLVRPPVAYLGTAFDPTSGRSTQIGLVFRLDRTLPLKPSKNARAIVTTDGRTSEFVSRIGKRRAYCYAAASVKAIDQSVKPGDEVSIEIKAMRGVLRLTPTVRSKTDSSRRTIDMGCGGRKER